MVCSFCSSPAAHPATGCQYGPSTLACRACVESFWMWLRSHTNKRPRRGHGPETALSFYEAATLFSLPVRAHDGTHAPSSSTPADAASGQCRHASDASRDTDR